MIRDGDELAARRQVEEHARTVARIRSGLIARLARVTADDPAVAMMARLDDGLELPWETDADASSFRRFLNGSKGVLQTSLEHAERLEVLYQFQNAVSAYQDARRQTRQPFERDYIDLLSARAMGKCGCGLDPRPTYRALLHSLTVDEEGVPIALYAASQLLDLTEPQLDLTRLFTTLSAQRRWLSPPALHMASALVARQGATSTALDAAMDDQSRALRLAREFHDAGTIGGMRSPNSPEWFSFDRGVWIVSAKLTSDRPSSVIAVRSAQIARDIEPMVDGVSTGSLSFTADETHGQVLDFAGLAASFRLTSADTVVSSWSGQRRFYVIALITVLGITVVGGVFVWRSVRREVRLAELRSQFVASVSHELKTPLTAIRMFAETLQMDRPLDSTARAEYLATIVNESERLSRLINNVLDYSKIERGQKVYRLETGPLAPVLQNAARTMQYPLERLGFGLRVQVTPEPLPVRMDEDAIEQAVLNLLSNAMKYSRERREIDLRLWAGNGHAVIEVTDYGVGISSAEQPRIFDRFYRAGVPENDRIPGAGLGLALVEHIVKAHGGRVGVKSAINEGSTFAIYLPLVMDGVA